MSGCDSTREPPARESIAGAKRWRLTRLGRREVLCWAVRGGTRRGSREAGAGDARTAGTSSASDEDRSERAPASRLGLQRSR
ncbi:hypothetical protein BN903_72 [Halorubrum sp. AJ67]|nr:hypothetical protein BN903_72 [Halorubrum sp. AJ67]